MKLAQSLQQQRVRYAAVQQVNLQHEPRHCIVVAILVTVVCSITALNTEAIAVGMVPMGAVANAS